jgi:hypothetical protein
MKKHKLFKSIGIGQIALLLVLLLSIDNYLPAQEVVKSGTSAATFLRVPVGARGTSMGSAFVSVANDASAVFWNPGGVARMPNYALMVDFSSWLPGLSFSYFGVVLPTRSAGTLGVSVTALGTEEMDITTPEQPMGTGEKFDATSLAVAFTYARNLMERFSLGANVKYVNEKILNSSANGFAFDVGALYDTPFPNIRLGFSIANVGTKMQMSGEDLNIRVDIAPNQNGNNQSVTGSLNTGKFDMPLIMRLGLSWDAINTERSRLTLAADGINPNDNAQSVNVGAEFSTLNQMLVLRGGFNDLFLEQRETGLTLGAGVKAQLNSGLGFTADYAYQDFEHLGNISRFSFVLVF